MHLVILTQVLDHGDAVLGFFHTWCERFALHVSRLTVIAQEVGATDLPDNVDVVSLGREHGAGRLAMWWRMNRALRGMGGDTRPDAILAHMVPRFVLSVAPLARRRGVPLYLWYTHAGVDRSLRMATPLVHKVFTASAESFRLPTPPGQCVVTGHGIDLSRFSPGGGPRHVDVLAVGRIAPSKGQDELLDALGKLDVCPITEIAGDVLLDYDIAFRDGLHARAAVAFGDRVRWLGAVPHPRVGEVMGRARVLVSTSHTGSVDKVVLEAMCAGCLPLTCNESFAPIFGEELAARLMFPPGDVDALAMRLRALLELPGDAAGALAGRLRALVVEHHDLDRLIPRLVAEMDGVRPAAGQPADAPS